MLFFLSVFAVSVIALLLAQAVDIEGEKTAQNRPGFGVPAAPKATRQRSSAMGNAIGALR